MGRREVTRELRIKRGYERDGQNTKVPSTIYYTNYSDVLYCPEVMRAVKLSVTRAVLSLTGPKIWMATGGFGVYNCMVRGNGKTCNI